MHYPKFTQAEHLSDKIFVLTMFDLYLRWITFLVLESEKEFSKYIMQQQFKGIH